MKQKKSKQHKIHFKKNSSSSIKNSLKEYETKAYKQFGQNFLLDKQYVDFMVNGLEIQKKDFVIEIGPGMGALTDEILNITEEKNYLAIEIDAEKVIFLKRKNPQINIINTSILTFDLEKYLKENNIISYKVIGSLPFNISKKIFQKFCEINIKPEKAVFMVQKEVGENYTSRSTSTFLSIYISQYYDVESTQIVPGKAFYPVPKVDGMSIILRPLQSQIDPHFIKFVKRGFISPRKKLGNILNLSKDNPYKDKRPHEISLEGWKDLYNLNLQNFNK